MGFEKRHEVFWCKVRNAWCEVRSENRKVNVKDDRSQFEGQSKLDLFQHMRIGR